MDFSNGEFDLGALRVAIIHYWIVSRRGGERVLEVLADMFPQADLFTMVLDRRVLAPFLQDRRITTSFIQRIPGATRHYKKLMPLFPLALEQFRLEDYDLVLSHEAGPAKGVLTKTRACHICYSHSPMRYVWDMYQDYRASAPFGVLGRTWYSLSAHYLRLWDHAAASRVDYFIASSRNGARRIAKHYKREADLVYPPVDLRDFSVGTKREDFYLMVSPLVAYKRVDLAIKVCNQLRRRLIIVGQGELMQPLKGLCGPTVQLLGRQPDEIVRDLYSRCRAFIFPGEEDIGLTPIEAQASGCPVIAFARGGALETVRGIMPDEEFRADATGLFFEEQTPQALEKAILRFESLENQFSPEALRANAEQFDVEHFKRNLSELIGQRFGEFRRDFIESDSAREPMLVANREQ